MFTQNIAASEYMKGWRYEILREIYFRYRSAIGIALPANAK